MGQNSSECSAYVKEDSRNPWFPRLTRGAELTVSLEHREKHEPTLVNGAKILRGVRVSVVRMRILIFPDLGVVSDMSHPRV